jgi:sugar lactone lactonase YvrE
MQTSTPTRLRFWLANVPSEWWLFVGLLLLSSFLMIEGGRQLAIGPAEADYLLAQIRASRASSSSLLWLRIPHILLTLAAFIPFFWLLCQSVRPAAALAACWLLITQPWFFQSAQRLQMPIQAFLLLACCGVALLQVQALWPQRATQRMIWFWVGGASLAMGLTLWQIWPTELITSSMAFQNDPTMALRRQIGQTLLPFWDGRLSTNPEYTPAGEPWLNLISRVLILFGLVVAWRGRPANWLWWGWLGLVMIVSQILATSTPDPRTAFLLLPALYAFAGMSFEWLCERLAPHRWAPSALLLGAAWLGVQHYQAFHEWQARDPLAAAGLASVPADQFAQWQANAQAYSIEREQPIVPTAAAVQDPAAPLPPPAGTWPTLVTTIDTASLGIRELRAIAIGTNGVIYALDSALDRQTITAIGLDGNILTTWGGPGSPEEDGRFVNVWAIASTPQGEILALDAETGWVHVFSQEGRFLRRWGGPALQLYRPRAFSAGSNGTIAIADTGGQRVVTYDAAGNQLAIIGKQADAAASNLQEPAGVAIANDGSILVADAVSGRIHRYAPDGSQLTVWPAQQDVASEGPRIASSPDGAIYVVFPSSCQAVLYTLDGSELDRYGECQQPAILRQPSGISISSDGRLLIADLAAHRILIFQR